MSEMTTSAVSSFSDRASASRVQRSGTMFVPSAPPWMLPTFAVVSGSIRPRRIAAIARAAARIALRPSSGRTPACAAWPRNVAPGRAGGGAVAGDRAGEPVEGRRGHDDLADRRGVVVDVAELRTQLGDVECLRAL